MSERIPGPRALANLRRKVAALQAIAEDQATSPSRRREILRESFVLRMKKLPLYHGDRYRKLRATFWAEQEAERIEAHLRVEANRSPEA